MSARLPRRRLSFQASTPQQRDRVRDSFLMQNQTISAISFVYASNILTIACYPNLPVISITIFNVIV
jgi:hypothetical protein